MRHSIQESENLIQQTREKRRWCWILIQQIDDITEQIAEQITRATHSRDIQNNVIRNGDYQSQNIQRYGTDVEVKYGTHISAHGNR